MDKVLILGAGVMGSALAVHLGKKGHKINVGNPMGWKDD